MADSTNSRFKKKKVFFTQVSNEAIRDKRLSLKSKGLFSLIQSYITIEDFNLFKGMLEEGSSDRETGFNTAWRELKKYGYLTQEKLKDESGTWYYEYDLIDNPLVIQEEEVVKTPIKNLLIPHDEPIKPVQKEPYTFDEFWSDYKMFVGKSKAVKCWGKIKTKDKLIIKTHLKKYIPHTTDNMGQPCYRKHASSYLNQKAWEDEIINNQGQANGIAPTSTDTTQYSLGENEFKV
jgi:hypothetical protein